MSNVGAMVGRHWVQGIALASLLGAGVAHAGVPAPANPSPYPTFLLALSDDPEVIAAYALVPNDSPALLPLKVDSTVGWGPHLSDVPIVSTANVTVEGDPTGAVTAYAQYRFAVADLAWTEGATREFGRSYVASLATGEAGITREGSPVFYGQSSFEFSYFDGSSAEFLAQADLTLSDVQEDYGPAERTCCEVDAGLCSGASSCFQCWDQTGTLSMYPVWTGPGLPYLSLETEPLGTIQVTEFGEYCAQGTASAAGETRSFSVCHTVSEWPSVEVEGRQTVFADSCRSIPPGYSPLTRLFVVRGETQAEAQQRFSSVRTSGQPHDSDPAARCGLASRPVESNALPWLATLAVLGAAGRRRVRSRRQSGCRNPGR